MTCCLRVLLATCIFTFIIHDLLSQSVTRDFYIYLHYSWLVVSVTRDLYIYLHYSWLVVSVTRDLYIYLHYSWFAVSECDLYIYLHYSWLAVSVTQDLYIYLHYSWLVVSGRYSWLVTFFVFSRITLHHYNPSTKKQVSNYNTANIVDWFKLPKWTLFLYLKCYQFQLDFWEIILKITELSSLTEQFSQCSVAYNRSFGIWLELIWEKACLHSLNSKFSV